MVRVAVCDDELVALDGLQRRIVKEFRRQGMNVCVTGFVSGKELLDAHREKPFHAIFLDIDMPQMSGFDVASKIGDSEQTLIVFVTMHDELVYSSLRFQPLRFMRKRILRLKLKRQSGR